MNQKLLFFLNQDTKGVIAEVHFLCTYDQQTEFSLILCKKPNSGCVDAYVLGIDRILIYIVFNQNETNFGSWYE